MIIGVVSDTHLPRFGRELPKPLVRGLIKAQVETIVHCGDITDAFVLDLFAQIAPVVAVAGNNDGKQLHQELGERTILAAGEARIGVVHGHAGKGRTTPDRAFNAFDGEGVNAILFGHSHIPHKSRRDGVLLFNPGSPTDKRMNPAYTYGIVRVADGKVQAAHRFYFSRA